MRLFAVALLMPVAFLIGRATNPTAASAQTENRVYTLLQNDVVRAPGAATRCTASVGVAPRVSSVTARPRADTRSSSTPTASSSGKTATPTSPPSQPAGNADNSRGPASSS
jgi:hypothetical protein